MANTCSWEKRKRNKLHKACVQGVKRGNRKKNLKCKGARDWSKEMQTNFYSLESAMGGK